jgi:O-6-methylguanine DNA methyltransferase
VKEEILKTPFGLFKLLSEKNEILSLEFVWDKKLKETNPQTSFAKDVKKQLIEYFSGKRKKFDLKVSVNGTHFQKKVWDVVSKIPFGKTLTYKDVAEKLGNKNLSRAVGLALKSNKVVIIIPCHRVIAKNGIGGFSGKSHQNIKKKLLNLEGVII